VAKERLMKALKQVDELPRIALLERFLFIDASGRLPVATTVAASLDLPL